MIQSRPAYGRFLKQVRIFGFLCAFLAIFLTGCEAPRRHEAHFTPVTYADLPGWDEDKISEALPAMIRSCRVLTKGGDSEWVPFCSRLTESLSSDALRDHMKAHLIPHLVSDGDNPNGLFTGYYEPELEGSRRRHGKYQIPLYRMPKSGVNYRIPRSKIVSGALARRGLELVWVDSAIDAFFIQIQGSGRVRLEDGSLLHLGYAGQNGKPYVAIGKILKDRGALDPDNVSMQSIKAWLVAHPKQAESIMSMNPSYVFFRVLRGTGPLGSQGVPLTPHRSLAVDRDTVSLGTPVWLTVENPVPSRGKIQRLMVAQDTGGAIKGVVRGDYFWGHGPEAAEMAGIMKSPGQYYVFLPK